jgi:hypothetical protein
MEWQKYFFVLSIKKYFDRVFHKIDSSNNEIEKRNKHYRIYITIELKKTEDVRSFQ